MTTANNLILNNSNGAVVLSARHRAAGVAVWPQRDGVHATGVDFSSDLSTGIQMASPVSVQGATGITAATTQTQGQGLLSHDFNDVTTVANPHDAVTLPPAKANHTCTVVNASPTNPLQIFPYAGQNLGAGWNPSVSLDPGKVAQFWAIDSSSWRRII